MESRCKETFSPLLFVTAVLAGSHPSYGGEDGMIGPCAPDRPRGESVSWSGDRSGSAASDGAVAVVGSLAKAAIDDAEHLLTSPLRIDGKSALVLGGIAAGIDGLLPLLNYSRAGRQAKSDLFPAISAPLIPA